MKRRFWPACLALLALGSAPQPDYRKEMRGLVADISSYARSRRPGFAVIAGNALPLLTQDGTPKGRPEAAYVSALDAVAQESLFYSHDRGPTQLESTRLLVSYLDLAKGQGLRVLVLDYPATPAQARDCARRCRAKGYLSFAASKALDRIPPRLRRGARDVGSLKDAQDFLYIIDPGRFADRKAYLGALRKAGQDFLVVDLFFGDAALSAEEVAALKVRPNGRRLVLAYMSVGEAEEYRYYWKSAFKSAPPAWLEAANPAWPDNHKVRYWEPGWRRVLFGGEDSYLDRILAAGFDGVYLDVVDAYQYFEEQPVEAGPRP